MWSCARGANGPRARILVREAGAHEPLAFVALETLFAGFFIASFHLVLLTPARLRRLCGEAFFHERRPLIVLPFSQSFIVRLGVAERHLALLRGCRDGKWCNARPRHKEGHHHDTGCLRHAHLLW
jgi:hypothetical protein